MNLTKYRPGRKRFLTDQRFTLAGQVSPAASVMQYAIRRSAQRTFPPPPPPPNPPPTPPFLTVHVTEHGHWLCSTSAPQIDNLLGR